MTKYVETKMWTKHLKGREKLRKEGGGAKKCPFMDLKQQQACSPVGGKEGGHMEYFNIMQICIIHQGNKERGNSCLHISPP